MIKRSPPAIRKKACLVACKIVKRTGEIFEYYGPGLEIICDRQQKNYGLKTAAVSLMLRIIKTSRKARKKLRKSIGHIIRALRDLVLSTMTLIMTLVE